MHDVTGRISSKDFHKASDREVSFMKKNYIPSFDEKDLGKYLLESLGGV